MLKKITLSLIALTACALNSATYQELRDQLKSKLYRCQKRVLNESQYSDFIEPYLQEGEVTWTIPQHCRAHEADDSTIMENYFDAIVNYNIATFGQYIDRSAPYKKAIKKAKKKLMAAIQAIKDAWGLRSLDTKHECEITTELLHRASAQYYKNLSFKYKTLCLVEKVRRLF